MSKRDARREEAATESGSIESVRIIIGLKVTRTPGKNGQPPHTLVDVKDVTTVPPRKLSISAVVQALDAAKGVAGSKPY